MNGTLLWLLAIAVLALVAAVVLRRMARLAGGTHDLEHLKAGVVGVNQRLAEVVDPLTGHLDEVRRGSRDPLEASTEVAAALVALRDLSKQARSIKAPAALADRTRLLVWEVDRAVRAADMASHGIAQLGRARQDGGIEAQTALKRGTLGLRHAREAVTRIMISVAKLTPVDVRAMPVPTGSARFGAIATPPVDEDLVGVEGPPPT
jgi:hypothetical protein